MKLYGLAPKTTFTRLTANAAVGATTITVDNLEGWSVGDKIVVAPSGRVADQF